MLPVSQKSMVIYEYECHCDSPYEGRTSQRLQERIKQHVPKAIRQKTTLTQEQGTHRSQPTRTQPNRKWKAKSKTQFKPESDSAISRHLLESNQCACKYSDSQFKILITARSQFHLSLLEAVYISRKKQIWAGKSSSYLHFNCFEKIRAYCLWIDCVSPYYCETALKSFLLTVECIYLFRKMHFFFLQSAFLLTAFGF